MVCIYFSRIRNASDSHQTNLRALLHLKPTCTRKCPLLRKPFTKKQLPLEREYSFYVSAFGLDSRLSLHTPPLAAAIHQA